MDNYKIGLFLVRLREEKSMTQEEVGDYVGVSNKAVSKWETGDGLPNYEAMVALSTLYGVSINEILAGKRNKENELKELARSKEEGIGAYYALNIISLLLFATAILALMISNFAGNAFIGGIISLLTFVMGGICYGCSFIFGKRHCGLIIANNVTGLLALGQAAIGASTLGYMGTFDYLTMTFLLWISMSLALTAPVSIALGIYTKKAFDEELSLKGFMIKYAHKILSSWLFGIALYFLIILIANMTVNHVSSFIYILIPSLFIILALATGIPGLKYRLSGVIGAWLVVLFSVFYIAWCSGKGTLNFPFTPPQDYFVYPVDGVVIIIYALAIAVISTISYVQFRKNLK